MNKIIVVGDASSTNLGDPILTYCCEYIVKQCSIDVSVCCFDIAGRHPSPKIMPTSSSEIHENADKSNKMPFISNLVEDLKALIKWYIGGKSDFSKRLSLNNPENSDFVIAGGALISSSLFYALSLNYVVNIAKRNNRKVVFNAVGVEKTIYNFGLAKYVVRHYLRKKEVVAFSTRDHLEDIPYLTNRNEFYKLIPDPGLFASEAFDIQKQDSDTIGLSVISYNAYRSIAQNDKRA